MINDKSMLNDKCKMLNHSTLRVEWCGWGELNPRRQFGKLE